MTYTSYGYYQFKPHGQNHNNIWSLNYKHMIERYSHMSCPQIEKGSSDKKYTDLIQYRIKN